MHGFKMRKRISFLLVLSLLLCGMCFDEQPLKTYSFCDAESELSSSVRIFVTEKAPVIQGERLTGRSQANVLIRRENRRTSNSFIRRSEVGFSFVDFLPQTFHSSIFLQNSEVSHNTSGHIKLMQCIYRKDGKKKAIL